MFSDQRFTVSQITDLIRTCLEGTFASVAVEGEVSNCRPSSTGHLYFTLKDSGAAISAVMFKNKLRSLDFEPSDGMLVRVKGSLSVYAQRGTYQIVCDSIERAGVGELLALLEERKKRLAAEGLFDADRKKPLPRFPERIGVVSSPTGAALRDILNVLTRRAAGVDIVILPAPVQGAEAAAIIARRIEQANDWKLADVLIVGRGGGSIEDLLPFSEEVVVRAVAASKIPVVSAVGHEIDWALSDFAADLRAPTPSAAAELVSGDRAEATSRVREIGAALHGAIESRLERARLATRPFAPEDLEFRFRSILQPRLIRFDDAKEELCDALSDRVCDARRRVALAVGTLEAANPSEILSRGFSIVIDESTGRVVRDASCLSPGNRIRVRPLKGSAVARVEEIRAEENV
ncbi:MAG: exodeoxyribonuclease VII large subunit [Treponemataceae bacterium]